MITAVKAKPTIKKVEATTMMVEETLDRDLLWEVQTPQTFKKDIILEAHKNKKDEMDTDDAAFVEQLGVKVKILEGDYKNIKVTTQEDLVIAEAFLCNRKLV